MTTMALSKVTNGARYLREQGLKTALKEARFRAVNKLRDLWHGVDTIGGALPHELGFTNADMHGYDAQGYRELRDTFKRIPIPTGEMVCLDIGSGKARPGVVAAAMGCRRVINLELAESLHVIAEKNFARMRGKRTKDVECVLGDATTYAIPTDVNVIVIANSFVGETLEKVVHNIWESYDANPRPLVLVYFNVVHFEKLRKEKNLCWFTLLLGDLVHPRYSRYIYRVGDRRAPPMRLD